MAEPLNREQFRTALAQAIDGVLNVYSEVDAMLRELAMALAADEPRFKALVKRLVPGAGKNPDTRFLRDYHASAFSPADAEDEDDEEDDEDEESEDDEDGASKKLRKALTVPAGSGIVLARAAIYDRGATTFEPNLLIASLQNWRVAGDIAPGTPIRITRTRIKRLLRIVDSHRWGAGKAISALKTQIPVQPLGFPKGKHTLLCDITSLPERLPLFDVTPAAIQGIASRVRATWSTLSTRMVASEDR
jgi:hypothetical protein